MELTNLYSIVPLNTQFLNLAALKDRTQKSYSGHNPKEYLTITDDFSVTTDELLIKKECE